MLSDDGTFHLVTESSAACKKNRHRLSLQDLRVISATGACQRNAAVSSISTVITSFPYLHRHRSGVVFYERSSILTNYGYCVHNTLSSRADTGGEQGFSGVTHTPARQLCGIVNLSTISRRACERNKIAS